MKLGYHYHVPVFIKDGQIWTQSYLGVFFIALAEKIDQLILFLHEDDKNNDNKYDFNLNHEKIQFVSLGNKKRVWYKILFSHKYVRKINREIKQCDAIILRSPSPLSPSLYKKFKNKTKIIFLIIGNYTEGIKHLKQPWYRLYAIKILLSYNQKQLDRALRNQSFFVNEDGYI